VKNFHLVWKEIAQEKTKEKWLLKKVFYFVKQQQMM
jgi:hypothetical protein